MTMTDDDKRSAERAAVEQLVDAGLLDELMDRVDAGDLRLTGEGGFLPEMIKAVLERGLAAELTDHLGYDKGDPAGREDVPFAVEVAAGGGPGVHAAACECWSVSQVGVTVSA